MQLFAHLRLGFPSAPELLSLNLATYGNSQAHSTKGTPSHAREHAPTACKSTVSGSLSLRSRGAFHLSLTVLCAIGSYRVFSLGGWSPQLPARFLVPRRTQDAYPRSRAYFAYRTFTSSGRPSQWRSAILSVSTLRGPVCTGPGMILQPRQCNAAQLTHRRFRLFPFRSPLLRESRLFSSPAGT